STDDLSVVSQVLGRPPRQRRLLRRHGIRQVPGRTARTVDEAVAFLAEVGTPVLVLPRSRSAGASATMVEAGDEKAMREALSRQPGNAVFLRGHPPGDRFLVLANRQRAAAVLCRSDVAPATSLTTREVDRLAK